MARRNMRMEEYLELVYQWHRGRSIRQIRDSLQISRKTIRKYLLFFMASGLSREKPLPPQAELARIVASVVQVAVFEQPARERIRLYHRQIQDWLGQPHMTIQQVQRLLEEEHELKVSYMSVYRYVREHIEPLRKPVTVRLHAVAGEQAQVDFGYAGLMRDPETGKQRKAWAFIMILSTLVHKYTNVFLGGGFQFVHELVQVVTSKFPLKRLSNGGVMLLKAQKPFFEGLQGKEVVRGKNFALDNGEIDLDLVQPTRMDGSVDGDDSRIFALKPADAAGSPVSRSIVQNPEDSSGFFIGSLGHDLIDQAAKRSNPIFSFTATEELGPMHIQCCQISPSAAARVFMFHLHRDAGLRGEGSMPTAACLDAGFFVGGEDEFTVFQRMPQPHSLIQVEDTPRFFGEMGVSRENPAAMLPRADGVLMEPAPDGGPADAGDQPGLAHLGGQIGAAPSRDGQSEGGGQLTGQGFNLDHYLWGEKTGGDPAESSPPDPSGVFRKSAFARNIPPLDGYPNVSRSHHYANPGLPGESSWLAVPENTVTYIFGHEPIVLFPHLAIERSYTGCVEALWNSFQVTTMPNQPDIIR